MLLYLLHLLHCERDFTSGCSSRTLYHIIIIIIFALQHCVSGDIRDLVKERWYKSLHADRLTPTTGVAEELLHKLKYLYKDSYS